MRESSFQDHEEMLPHTIVRNITIELALGRKMSPEMQCAFPLTCGSFFWKHDPLNLSNAHFKPACNRNQSLAVTATGYCEVCVSDFVVVWGIDVVENLLCADIKKRYPVRRAYAGAPDKKHTGPPWDVNLGETLGNKRTRTPEFKMVVPTAWLGHGIFVNRL